VIPWSNRSQDGSDLSDWQVFKGPLHHCRVANPADFAAQYGAPLQTADCHTLELGHSLGTQAPADASPPNPAYGGRPSHLPMTAPPHLQRTAGVRATLIQRVRSVCQCPV